MSTPYSLRKRFMAEILGTFFLVFIGTLSITMPTLPFSGASALMVGLAFGVGAIGAAYSFGHVSGAHINPVVTVSLALRDRFPWKEVVPYIIAQLIGAVCAALLNASIVGRRLAVLASLGGTYPNSEVLSFYGVNPTLAAFVCEMVITFILVFTILCSTEKDAPSGFAGLAIGLILGMNVTVAANISGGSMNPARTFGPQIALLLFGVSFDTAFDSAWIYWVSPFIGGYLAALVHQLKS